MPCYKHRQRTDSYKAHMQGAQILRSEAYFVRYAAMTKDAVQRRTTHCIYFVAMGTPLFTKPSAVKTFYIAVNFLIE